MKGAAIRSLGTTVVERVAGGQPGRGRAMVAAVVTGAATAAAAYKLLRSGGGEDDED
jgi:hypothetical protein